jgi:dipeptidyl aminopeptidase/acylaminoacyl peptidase
MNQSQFATAESYWWQADDGLKIHGWLYRAKDHIRGTIIHVHGGPSSHSTNDIDPEIQYYVARGFNVLAPNYRGSTGYGLAFYEKIKEDGWGGKEQDDIISGIKALIQDGIAKEYQVGVTGTSYGGYAAWCAITRCPTSLVAAAVPICGMTDLTFDYETTRLELQTIVEVAMGGKPSEIPEKYFERSPINYVQNIKGALLIVHGMEDTNVDPRNMVRAEARLKANGIRYDKLVFANEGHGIGQREHMVEMYQRIASFFGVAFHAQARVT